MCIVKYELLHHLHDDHNHVLVELVHLLSLNSGKKTVKFTAAYFDEAHDNGQVL